MRSSKLGLLGLGAACALALSVNAGGCQSDGNSGVPTGSGGNGGEGASASDGGGGATSSSSGTAGGGGDGGGGEPVQVVTIEDITKGLAGLNAAVQVMGVVAMSPKFLASKSSTGSCLWGVYLSMPGLTTTQPYSGILALSYGSQATTGQNNELFCAKLGEEPAGDAFPDDVKPGDVLNVTGNASYFKLGFCGDACGDLTCTDEERACYDNMNCMEHRCWEDCASDPLPYMETAVQQRQLMNVTRVEKVGSATPPEPHTVTSEELLALSSADNQSFHDMWGGVKVRIVDVAPVPWSQGNVVNYGRIVVAPRSGSAGGKLQIGNNIYYRGYAPMSDYCHKSPVFADSTVTWTRIDGFSTLDTCIWTLQASDMCADFDPASSSCGAAMSCAQ